MGGELHQEPFGRKALAGLALAAAFVLSALVLTLALISG